MGIAYPNPPSFSFDAKENEAKENFSHATAPIFQACYNFSLDLFDARNSGLKPLKQDGLAFKGKPKYYGAFANGSAKKLTYRPQPDILNKLKYRIILINNKKIKK